MKGGVEVLTRYLAAELGARRIAVNTLAPGAIETDFGGGAVRDNADLNASIAKSTPLGRVGVPDDIGGAAAALLSGGGAAGSMASASRWRAAFTAEFSERPPRPHCGMPRTPDSGMSEQALFRKMGKTRRKGRDCGKPRTAMCA